MIDQLPLLIVLPAFVACALTAVLAGWIVWRLLDDATYVCELCRERVAVDREAAHDADCWMLTEQGAYLVDEALASFGLGLPPEDRAPHATAAADAAALRVALDYQHAAAIR